MDEREDLPLTTTKRHKFFYGYVVAAAGFGVWLIGWGTYGCISLFYKPLIVEFGWTRAAIAGAFSLSGIVMGFLGIVMGRLTDRFGPRIVVPIFGSFQAIGFLLVSQLSAIWKLYLIWGGIKAVGMSTFNVPVM